jgi:hypothetical protein
MKRTIDDISTTSDSAPRQAKPELERQSADVASLNRHFGSQRLVDKFLWSWFQPGGTYRVLDLSAGSGEIPRFITSWCEQRNIVARIDAVEPDAAKLEFARAHGSNCPNIQWICANPLTYESPLTYNLVYCSLLPHRYGHDDTVKLLHHCRELSNQFVVIADLERNPVSKLGVWFLTTFVMRQANAHDYGQECVDRAFTWRELRQLAKAAGWENFGHARILLCSQAIWLFKRDLGEVRPLAMPVADVLPCPT